MVLLPRKFFVLFSGLCSLRKAVATKSSSLRIRQTPIEGLRDEIHDWELRTRQLLKMNKAFDEKLLHRLVVEDAHVYPVRRRVARNRQPQEINMYEDLFSSGEEGGLRELLDVTSFPPSATPATEQPVASTIAATSPPSSTPVTTQTPPPPVTTTTTTTLATTQIPSRSPVALETPSPTTSATEAPMQVPTGTPTKIPTKSPTALPTEALTEAPTESATTEAPTESATTEAPTESATTEAPTESATTEAPTESATTEAPTESATTEAPTESATTIEPDTFAPSVPVTNPREPRFNISHCESYAFDWLLDLENTCDDIITLEGCSCPRAEALLEAGEITCAEPGDSSPPACPTGCEVCKQCLVLIGCPNIYNTSSADSMPSEDS